VTEDEGRQPALYGELAPWFHLLSAPSDYEIGARHALDVLTEAIGEPPATILELGSGGGNNASHMKEHATLTLTDLSPEMLELSTSLNPDCEHVQGDMTSLRLGRTFDAVFAHDAVSYLVTEGQLRAAIETAWIHCRAGGAVLFEPDHTLESYADGTDHGGHDAGHDGLPDDGRSLRYLQWRWDPDPNDTW
jgi:SAM-dependent methyltransferase